MTVGLYASRSHYADHMVPIWEALPRALQGPRCAPREAPWTPDGTPHGHEPQTWMVASYTDAQALQGRARIYVNHGAGQRYEGDPRSAAHGAFVGGAGLESIRLFLDPREECSAIWRARYPQAVAEAVGCPRLDRWHTSAQGQTSQTPTIGVAFHHQGGICPESTWALPYYRGQIERSVAAWRAAGLRVVGHGHPLAEASLRRLWAEHGVPWVDVDTLFAEADLLVMDNSSLLVEFASLGKPVVWLNASWYRRDAEHGSRFWSWPRGQVQVDDPEDLTDSVLYALLDPPWIAKARARMVESIYMATDGRAAERAAAAIVALVGSSL